MTEAVTDKIRIGGLMRCCIETVGDLYPDGPAQTAHQGQILQCKYAEDNPEHRMIFRDGAWEWLEKKLYVCLAVSDLRGGGMTDTKRSRRCT